MASRGLSEVLSDFTAAPAGERRQHTGAFSLLGNQADRSARAEFVQWPIGSAERIRQPPDDPVPHISDIADVGFPSLAEDEQTSDGARDAVGGSDELPDRAPDQEIAQLREEHAAEIARIRREVADGELGALSHRLTNLECVLLEQLEASVASVLGRVFGDEIADESLIMLCKWLKARLAQPGLMQVEISGPKELTAKLMQQLDDSTDRYRIIENDSADIRVEINGEVLSTRLGEWRRMAEDCLR